jgi:hypothetical protein
VFDGAEMQAIDCPGCARCAACGIQQLAHYTASAEWRGSILQDHGVVDDPCRVSAAQTRRARSTMNALKCRRLRR